ncbi:hypothetical protein APHAL10511_002945 [Amanita phalloides]|nr:hypothetical protein APHAL10511_002945 [Amanita phalloides]
MVETMHSLSLLDTSALMGYTQSEYQQVGWSLKYEAGSSSRVSTPTIGLQIFETNKLEKALCELLFIFDQPSSSYTEDFTLDFSAETMSKAVVGG